MTQILSPEETFLQQAFHENRVAQICVHNEYSMIHYDTVEGTEDRNTMEKFCNDLAAYTKLLSPYALTVRTQYDIAMTNDIRRIVASKRELPFNEYFPKTFLPYDRSAMKVLPKTRKSIGNAYIDLIDPDFNDIIAISEESDAFEGAEGDRLIEKLRDNKRDVVMGTGLYAHACVKKFLHHAAQEDFTVYAVTDRILNHPWNERHRDKHIDIVNGYDPSIRRIGSERVLKLAGTA